MEYEKGAAKSVLSLFLLSGLRIALYQWISNFFSPRQVKYILGVYISPTQTFGCKVPAVQFKVAKFESTVRRVL